MAVRGRTALCCRRRSADPTSSRRLVTGASSTSSRAAATHRRREQPPRIPDRLEVGPAGRGDHRHPVGHGLDHRQPEGLRGGRWPGPPRIRPAAVRVGHRPDELDGVGDPSWPASATRSARRSPRSGDHQASSPRPPVRSRPGPTPNPLTSPGEALQHGHGRGLELPPVTGRARRCKQRDGSGDGVGHEPADGDVDGDRAGHQPRRQTRAAAAGPPVAGEVAGGHDRGPLDGMGQPRRRLGCGHVGVDDVASRRPDQRPDRLGDRRWPRRCSTPLPSSAAFWPGRPRSTPTRDPRAASYAAHLAHVALDPGEPVAPHHLDDGQRPHGGTLAAGPGPTAEDGSTALGRLVSCLSACRLRRHGRHRVRPGPAPRVEGARRAP